MKKAFVPYGRGGQPMPLSMREVVLVHFQNLSAEIVTDGLGQEYEPALDRLMNWLYWEFTEDPEHAHLKDEYLEVMGIKGTGASDVDKANRIQRKEWLLSRLLAAHRIHLGKSDRYEDSTLDMQQFMSIIPGREQDGLSESGSSEDEDLVEE